MPLNNRPRTENPNYNPIQASINSDSRLLNEIKRENKHQPHLSERDKLESFSELQGQVGFLDGIGRNEWDYGN